MAIINKAAILNPFDALAANITDYIPKATTSVFGIVAIGSGIKVDALGRIYLDTQEYSDRLTAIETEAASTLATQKSEVATAIAQINLTQSQTITALTLEVSNLKTNLTESITATQTELIDRADQLAQNITDISVQLAQDKTTFTQEIQDALTYLQNAASVASALRTPRKINGTDFDGSSDITTDTWGATRSFKIGNKTNSINGTSNVDYSLADIGAFPEVGGTIQGDVEVTGNLSVGGTISATLEGTAASADKLQTPRTISLTGGATGSVSFDGSANVSLAATITGLGVANGIATLDSSGKVPSTQLPSYVDDVLEFTNVAAFPATGETGKIYVETTGNTTYRWGGSGYVKITSGEVSSVAGKTGVVTLTKSDVGLPNVDDTADSSKSVASAAKLTTARTLGGVSFDGTANINLPGVNTTGNQSTTGNASTATTLQTARTINGASFNGSANIITTNWGTTRTLTLGSTGKAVNGSVDVSWSIEEILPTATNGQILKYNGTSWVPSIASNTPYTAMTAEEVNTGTATEERTITAAVLKGAIQTHAPVTGNAATATKLQTARTIAISGAVTGTATSFDGSANITIATTAIDGSKISTGIIPAAQIPTLNQSTTGNAGSATKLATARTISLTGAVTGSVNFDGTNNVNIDTTITGALGIANGGTGGTSAAEARTNLDVYSKDEVDTAITASVPIVVDASTVDKGIVKLATGSDIISLSETVAVTPKNVDDMLAEAVSLDKGFCALLSVRLTPISGTNNSSDNIITCSITGHGLRVGDIVNVEYYYRNSPAIGSVIKVTDTVVVTSVANVNTFTFTSPRIDAKGLSNNSTCKLLYVITNNYNVDSLTIIGVGRYSISINTNSGITETNFIPLAQATTANNSFVLAQPEAITSPTLLTVRTFDAAGSAISPQYLHIGVTK